MGGRPPLLAPSHQRVPHHAGHRRRGHRAPDAGHAASCSSRSASPAAVAKQATALQHLSGGRFVLGVGVGSHADEYARAGVDYHRRGRLMDEGIAAMQRRLGQRRRSGSRVPPGRRPRPGCRCGSAAPARPPAGGPPPSATAGPRCSSRADEYGPALDALRRETEQAGRRPDAVEPAVVVFARVGASDDEAPTGGARSGCPRSTASRPRRSTAIWWPGQPTRAPPRWAAYVEAGARHIIVMVAGTGAVRAVRAAAGRLRRHDQHDQYDGSVPAGVTG